jgi:hypothetical protein
VFFINRVQHPKTVVGTEANFPGGIKRRRLSKRLAIASLFSRLELQLSFDFRANQRVLFDLDRAQLLLGRRIVAYFVRLLACHTPIVEGRRGAVKPSWRGLPSR